MELATGQIHGDIIPKNKGRTVKVIRVEDGVAYCILITEIGGEPADAGKKIEIQVDEFHKFEMLHDPAEEVAVEKKKSLSRLSEDTIASWFEDNPLRIWLKDNKMAQETMAALVGVSVITIRHWMNGRNPNHENCKLLAAAMGLHLSEFADKWDRWFDQKPSP